MTRKVYDVIYNTFADRADFESLPEQFKQWRTVCTCKDEKTARNMLAAQNRLGGVSKIVERQIETH